MTTLTIFLSSIAVYLLVLPSAAFAYLDPVSGSMILQVALGGLFVAITTVKLYWRKIQRLFGKQSNDATDARAD